MLKLSFGVSFGAKVLHSSATKLLASCTEKRLSRLQGGKEAKHSNRMLHDIIVRAVEEEAPEVGRDLIGLVTSREGVAELLVHDDVIDLVIPRGSNALVSSTRLSNLLPYG